MSKTGTNSTGKDLGRHSKPLPKPVCDCRYPTPSPQIRCPRECRGVVPESIGTAWSNFDITFDVIPYAWGTTTMTAILPPALLKEDPQTIASGRQTARTHSQIPEAALLVVAAGPMWDQIVLYRSKNFGTWSAKMRWNWLRRFTPALLTPCWTFSRKKAMTCSAC